jgi:hypothetical protein
MNESSQNEKIYNKYTIIWDCPTNEAQGELTEDKLHEGQVGGGIARTESIQIRWFSRQSSKAGVSIRLESSQIKWFMRWPGREAGPGDWQPKTLKTKLSPRELSGLNTFRSDGACGSKMGHRRLYWVTSGQRCLNESQKMTLDSQGTYIKQP